VNGDIYYDSARNSYSFFNNGSWIDLASRSDVASAATLNSVQLTSLITQSSLIRITGSTSTILEGLTASSGGKSIILYNSSSANLIVSNQSSGEPTAANRITTPTGSDIVMLAGQAIQLMYDDGQTSWIVSSSSGGGSSGVSQEVSIPINSTSITVTFPSPQTSATYAIVAQMSDIVDPSVQFQPVTISNKTTTSFTASWNAPTATNSYVLNWMMPSAIINLASVSLSMIANIPSNTIMGNNTAFSAAPTSLTEAQVTAMMDVFTSLLQGVVPASGGGTTSFLRADGSWNPIGGANGANPSGAVLAYAGIVIPTGYLSCDGSSYATTTYPDLFAAVGYTYGGSGANFNVPNMAGKVAVGPGSTIGAALGGTGGEATHTLTIPEMPSHTHTISELQLNAYNSPYILPQNIPNSFGTTTTNATGGGGAHNNVQPYLCLNYIIKY